MKTKYICSFQIFLFTFFLLFNFSNVIGQEILNGLISRYTFTDGSLEDTQGFNSLFQMVGTNNLQGPVPANDRCGTPRNAYRFHNPQLPFFENASTTTQYLRTDTRLVTPLNYGNYTYCAWINVTTMPQSGIRSAILAIGNSVTSQNGDIQGGDQCLFIQNNGSNSNPVLGFGSHTYSSFNVFTTPIQTENNPNNMLNVWYFVCITNQLGNMNLYLNGVSSNTSNSNDFPSYSPNIVLTIGARHTDRRNINNNINQTPPTIQGFDGFIDDVRIYNRALTPCEIAQLYRQNPATQTQVMQSGITGPTNVCPGEEAEYSTIRQFNPCTFNIQPSQTNITWNVPNGATILSSNQDNTTIRIRFGNSGGTVSATEQVGNVSNCIVNSLNITMPSITTQTLPNGVLCANYNHNLIVNNAITPPSWTLIGGALPAGLSLASNGTISGIPTQTGNFSFTAEVRVNRCILNQTFNINIICPTVNIMPISIPNHSLNQPYPSQQFTQTGLCYTPNWTISAGVLPNGLTLTSNGLLSGTPTQAGTFSFTVRVNDQFCQAERQYTIGICREIPPITINNSQIVLCNNYSATLNQIFFNTTNGSIIWSSNNLPSWLSLNSTTGVITKIGEPTSNSPFSLNITVTQNGISSCSQNVILNMACPTNVTLSNATLTWVCGVGSIQTQITQIGLNSSCLPISWSATGLPTGWSINPTSGVISGTTNQNTPANNIVVTATQGFCNYSKTYTAYPTASNTAIGAEIFGGGQPHTPPVISPSQFCFTQCTLGMDYYLSPYNANDFDAISNITWSITPRATGLIIVNNGSWCTLKPACGLTPLGRYTLRASGRDKCGFNFVTFREIRIVSNLSSCAGNGATGGAARSTQNEMNEEISISPNPTSDLINLSLPKSEQGYELDLKDLQGKNLFFDKTSEEKYKLDLQNYPSGMYILYLKNGDKISIHKIVKQ